MTLFCERASKILGKIVKKADIKSHKVVGSINLPARDIFKIQDGVWSDWTEIAPTEENLPKSFNTLQELGQQVLISTSGPLRRMQFVREWLEVNGLLHGNFFPLGPNVPKVSLECDALVDDAPEQIGWFIEKHRIGFLYEQPWNLNAAVQGAIRIKSVHDLVSRYDHR